MKILKQKPIELVNTCGAIYDERALIAAMLWFAADPMEQKKKVFMYGRYAAVAIGHHKLHIHRLLMTHKLGGIKKGDYVHHKNENRLDNRIKNLEVMSASEHQRITNKGRKQLPEHVAKRTASMKKTRYENPELLRATE